MRSLQKTCLFLLTISLLVFSFESQLNTSSDIQLQQSEPNLTVEEVLEIALSDPDIAFFAEQYEAKVKIDLDGEVWVVHFVGGNGDDRTEIIVYIEDATGEIINIDWILSLQCCYYEEPEIIKKAVEFVKNLDILQSLQDNHEIEWWGYSRFGYDDVPIAYDSVGTNQEGVEYDNLINVWGNWDNGYVTVNVRAEELDLQVFGYDVLDVVATDYFGDPVNNFQAIETLALEDPLVMEYIKNHTDYGMDIILGLIVEALDYPFYDNNLSFATGYYYQVMFNSNHYDYPVTTVTDSSQDKGGLGLAQTEQGDYIVDDYYYYHDWLTVLIDDKTSTIVDHFGPNTNKLDRDVVIQIATSVPEIAEWLNEVKAYETYAYFDAYSRWFVNIYDTENHLDSAYVQINDNSGEVLSVDMYITIPATLTEDQANEIALSHPEVQEWVNVVDEFESYTWYDGFGNWYVSFNDKITWQNWVYLQIDDMTGDIITLELNLVPPPKMTKEQVLNIVGDAGLTDFESQYPNVEVYVNYDGEGIWYVSAYSQLYLEASIWTRVDDNTGRVLEYEENHPERLPEMTPGDLVNLLAESEDFVDWLENTDELELYVYYTSGYWLVNGYGLDQQGDYTSIHVEIDDERREIISINFDWYFLFHDDALQEDGSIGTTDQPYFDHQGVKFDIAEIEGEETIPLTTTQFTNFSNLFVITLTLFSMITIIKKR